MTEAPKYHAWLFWLAVATAVLAFILIGSGGTVTSTGVGMVDEGWTFSPFNLFTVRGMEQVINNLGMFIEHSHRQLGYIVGMCALALAALCYYAERGPRRWLGSAVLLAVCIQGALGAARILLNPKKGVIDPNLGRDFAMVHGYFGQLTFAFLVGCTLAFSRSWVNRQTETSQQAEPFQRLSKLLFIMFLVQLLLAVLVRHYGGGLLIIAHASVAGVILVMVLTATFQAMKLPGSLVKQPIYLLGIAVILMILLGTSAWWFGGGYGALSDLDPNLHRVTLATLHQWLGALTLATSLVISLRAKRHLIPLAISPEVVR
ncbi:MAG: hypothetical protein U0796_03950 [Gemmatales bacterium]